MVEAIETGVVRHVVDVVEHVDAEHHVALPTRRVGGMTDGRAVARLDAAATLHRVPMRRSTASTTNLLAVARVRGVIGRVRPDVVHGHSTIGGTVARLAALGSGRPVVYTPHGLSPRRAARVAERGLARVTATFVALSASEAYLAHRRGLAGPGGTVVVPNGIEPDPPAPGSPTLRERLGLAPGTMLVGTAGRLSAQKAPEIVIGAWGTVARSRAGVDFVWMGDGEGRPVAERAAAASGAAGRIHLLGHVDGAAAHLGELTVFSLGSRFEGGPYAPLEAMRAGVAVVATDVVGTRDCVDHGRTGVLVPPDDPEALATAILDLLDDDAGRARLGSAGRSAVRETHSMARMAERLDAVYQGVAAG